MCHLDLQASALASKMFYHGLDLLASTLVGKPACHHATQHAGWQDLLASTLASKTSSVTDSLLSTDDARYQRARHPESVRRIFVC